MSAPGLKRLCATISRNRGKLFEACVRRHFLVCRKLSSKTGRSTAGAIENRSSDRSFGIFLSVLVLGIGAWPLLSGSSPVFGWWVGGVLLLAVAFLRPRWLNPLNRAWFQLGLLLHRIVNPIVLGLIFVLSVIPIGLLMRLFGKDPLLRKFEPDRESYWMQRNPPGPEADSLPRQF